jgi:hypothetical protein
VRRFQQGDRGNAERGVRIDQLAGRFRKMRHVAG